MAKICTSIEQSKKLIELGLDVNTADMHHIMGHDESGKRSSSIAIGNPPVSRLYDIKFIPAWSLSALMSLLPSDFTREGKFGTFTYEIHIRKYRLTADIDVHQIAYGNYGSSGTWSDMINTGEYENLIDAAYKMVCWLLKNNVL